MSDWRDEIPKRWSKEDDFYSSGPVDPCAELRKHITDLKSQLAEARRREGLLRAVVEALNAYLLCDFNNTNLMDDLQDELESTLQAAIDGGALEGGE